MGERSKPQAERKANRRDSERGYCVVMGQKPIERPRVRSTEETGASRLKDGTSSPRLSTARLGNS